MNRVIKFRAWDRMDGRFLDENDNVPNFLNLVPSQSTGEFKPMYMEIESSDTYNTDMVLMQYTGMLDRNGVEIYEGDIVKLADSDLRIVEYIAPGFFLCKPEWLDQKPSGRFGNYNIDSDAFSTPVPLEEVIGNIWENKELLDE